MLIGASSQGSWLRVQFLEPEDLGLNLRPAIFLSLSFSSYKMGSHAMVDQQSPWWFSLLRTLSELFWDLSSHF